MSDKKKEIIHQLQKEILSLQGFKTPATNAARVGLGAIESAFPNARFPVAAIHEFICTGPSYTAATSGFIAGIVAALMQEGGASVWISSSRTIFPPALKAFGLEPDKIVFIDLQKERDLLWVMEEALKCNGIAAVICEIPDISFTASRRLQLAVEQSRVTGFIIRNQPRWMTVNACIASWKIKPLPTESEDGLPGIGFTRWMVALVKIRNGKPGEWQLEWSGDRFRLVLPDAIPAIPEPKRKTG